MPCSVVQRTPSSVFSGTHNSLRDVPDSNIGDSDCSRDSGITTSRLLRSEAHMNSSFHADGHGPKFLAASTRKTKGKGGTNRDRYARFKKAVVVSAKGASR